MYLFGSVIYAEALTPHHSTPCSTLLPTSTLYSCLNINVFACLKGTGKYLQYFPEDLIALLTQKHISKSLCHSNTSTRGTSGKASDIVSVFWFTNFTTSLER